MSTEGWWIVVGFLGQTFFSGRFLVQWLASERARRSVVPVAFWFFSLAGGVTLLAYALYRRDPVFIAGQGMGLLIYVRNLMLIRSESFARRAECTPAPGLDPGNDLGRDLGRPSV